MTDAKDTNAPADTTGSLSTVRKLRPKQNPALKLVLEMGPLVLFFITNFKFGIFPRRAC